MKREDSKPFSLTMTQAQELYGLLCCYMEESLWRDIWSTPKKRAQARIAVNRFARQLERHYRTGNYEFGRNGKIIAIK